jgi:hypothetical protein
MEIRIGPDTGDVIGGIGVERQLGDVLIPWIISGEDIAAGDRRRSGGNSTRSCRRIGVVGIRDSARAAGYEER